MPKKKIGLAILLMGLSGVVVAAGGAALQPRAGVRTLPLGAAQSPDILALPAPLWDAIEQLSPFFIGTSLVSIGAVLRTRKRREGSEKPYRSSPTVR